MQNLGHSANQVLLCMFVHSPFGHIALDKPPAFDCVFISDSLPPLEEVSFRADEPPAPLEFTREGGQPNTNQTHHTKQPN
jgi:hypothetical protein